MNSFLRFRATYFCFFCILCIIMIVTADSEKNAVKNFIFMSSNFLRDFLGRGAVMIEDATQEIQNTSDIRRENTLLKQEIAKYERRLRSLEVLQFENKALREILQFSLSVDYTILPTQVTSEGGIFGATQRIVIDKGSNDGIEKNMAVVASYDNSLVAVGRITEISRNSSQFVPITDIHFYLPVQTLQSKQNGILSGDTDRKNFLIFSNELIYDADTISVGEQVVVNKYSKFFPRGLPLGEIAEVTSNEKNSLLKIYVRPYLNLQNLDYVFALVPNSEKKESDELSEIIDDDVLDAESQQEIR